MNIYMIPPQMVETTKTFGEYITAIHLDIRELTAEELAAAFPDGLSVNPDEQEATVPDGSPSGQTAWTSTDHFIYHSTPKPDVEKVRSIIENHINAKTDAKILSGFVWTPPALSSVDGASSPDAGIPVWLSEENQRNFSEAQRVAMITSGQSLPMTFKLGEDANGNPIYHEFTTVEELTGFYLQAVAYINRCLNEGWAEKDAVDYDALFEEDKG